MADLALRGLTVTGPGGRALVRDVDLDVAAGERVLLAGPSGAGKSTVLRALAGLLDDDVEATGDVRLAGRAPVPGEIGLLVQDPLDAVVAETAGRDTAFGPENAGRDRTGIWRRVARAHAAARFTAGRDRLVATLSGGERQRLALAGTLAADPAVLLLDEPTAMLDAATADAVRAAVLEAAAGRSLVVVDHDLAAWAPHVDRVVLLGVDGRVAADGPPGRVLTPGLGLWVPGAGTPELLDVPVGLLEPALPLEGTALRGSGLGLVRTRRGLRPRPAATVLRDVDVTVRAGAVTALTGDSGAGKSSLLAVLAGLARPTGDLLAAAGLAGRRGRRAPHTWTSTELAARTGWVPQFPEHTFLAATVAAEAAATARVLGRDPARARTLLELLGLADRADANPFRLSGGEQRRLALAGALAAGPVLVLADEPSVGQDRGTWSAVAGLLRAAARDGAAVVVSTHDARLLDALEPAERVHLVSGTAQGVAA
ncbi:ATP-binding cassette domain-containing protein [Kineococcus rhizosphaerae]|uniref:Energy-coupling factor transport system ATP-binding protein n=1 Tax=Kineococcus rhizosphaerae TaxID=559628 RepID=A0A2T0R6W7_9ACTN|nr:ABC transporter ATP-binding protein [Kineococcus rhizosphaerae]PRY16912.1 energy-coupling factor transport system ATP-binding protein [Kineococcus rhizosphaerae]